MTHIVYCAYYIKNKLREVQAKKYALSIREVLYSKIFDEYIF